MIPLLILAGGKASRLKSVSTSTPKYLMPITPKKTFADFHLEWCRNQGFEHVLLSVGYFEDQIRSYIGDGSSWGINVQYVSDGPTPAGTGGAVKNSLAYPFKDLAVTFGDTLLELNAQNLYEQYLEKKCEVFMTVFKNTVSGHVCNADWQNPLVTYSKSSPQPNWQFIDYGFMIFSRQWIEKLRQNPPFDLAVALEEASSKKSLFGTVISQRFWEIGTPEALDSFKQKFAF